MGGGRWEEEGLVNQPMESADTVAIATWRGRSGRGGGGRSRGGRRGWGPGRRGGAFWGGILWGSWFGCNRGSGCRGSFGGGLGRL